MGAMKEMAQDAFLPKNYDIPKSSGSFSKLEEGTNKFRILGSPALGWIVWNNNKRHAFRTQEEIDVEPSREGDRPKHFWALPVWDYQQNDLCVLELTQIGIMESIQNLAKDEDYGSPVNYDIKIERTGKGTDTKYQVVPAPPKELTDDIKGVVDTHDFDPEHVFTGGKPFSEIKEEDQPGFEEEAKEIAI